MMITRFWIQRAGLGTNWFLQVTFAFKTRFSPLFVDFFNFSTEMTASDTFLHDLLYFFMMNYTWKTSRKSYLCVWRGYHGQIMMITRFWTQRAGLGTNWFLQVTFAFKTRFSPLFVDFFNFSTEMTASDTFLHDLLYFFMMNYTWKTSRKSYLCVWRGYHGQIMMITRFWTQRAGLGTNWFLKLPFVLKTMFTHYLSTISPTDVYIWLSTRLSAIIHHEKGEKAM